MVGVWCCMFSWCLMMCWLCWRWLWLVWVWFGLLRWWLVFILCRVGWCVWGIRFVRVCVIWLICWRLGGLSCWWWYVMFGCWSMFRWVDVVRLVWL